MSRDLSQLRPGDSILIKRDGSSETVEGTVVELVNNYAARVRTEDGVVRVCVREVVETHQPVG